MLSCYLSQNSGRILEPAELEAKPGKVVAQGDASRLSPESFSVVVHRPPVVVRADQRPSDLVCASERVGNVCL